MFLFPCKEHASRRLSPRVEASVIIDVVRAGGSCQDSPRRQFNQSGLLPPKSVGKGLLSRAQGSYPVGALSPLQLGAIPNLRSKFCLGDTSPPARDLAAYGVTSLDNASAANDDR